ncbi:MAG TPA: PhnD/SsuA/transferrin family substrate-binding protein [Candidatus Limnocylindrales bacterium]|nr:PhnD/SsuA/transferrin family substrate-binding protein [Candidatus Limnocylindrales bacterium]
MVGLTLTFYLGQSLVPVADQLAAALSERLGIAVAFDPTASDADRRDALDAPAPGIVWMCGLETVLRQDDGRLAASIIGAPVFPGRTAPVYGSVIVASERYAGFAFMDLERRTLAINQPDSWSGHHALRVHLHGLGRPQARFARVVVTGSHDGSIDALIDGRADVAAIDDTVWTARIARDPAAAALCVVDRTATWPAPPFSLTTIADAGLRAAIIEAIPTIAVPGLAAVERASDADYAVFRDGLAVSRSLAWPAP